MKWAPLVVVLAIIMLTSGCWRPYYNQQYAPPAYSQTPAYGQQPVLQGAPVYQQPGAVMQQPCQPCQPCICPPTCPPCY